MLDDNISGLMNSSYQGDALIVTSVRSSLSFALECVSRTSTPIDELERAIEKALAIASRKELEQTVFREVYRASRRLTLE